MNNPPIEHALLPTIIGRSSSHFTRITRIFAFELGIEHGFRIVPNLLATDPADYGGNPALRIPILETTHGAWFGALNSCRALARMSTLKRHVVWPEDLLDPLLANAQELILQAMATEVGLIMGRLADTPVDNKHLTKQRSSLLASLDWLERHVSQVLAKLPPERDLSFLEVALYCLVLHLDFRDIVPITPYAELLRFCDKWGDRASTSMTVFQLDT